MPDRAAPPLTLKRLERAMDVLCRIMSQVAREEALKLVPLYELLEREIGSRRSADVVIAAARAQARSSGRRICNY